MVVDAGARVVVFPELSLTGYHIDAPAVSTGDPALSPIVEACGKTGSLALVGAPTADGGLGPHISMLAVDGSGVEIAYRKIWLGSEETARFVPGVDPVVVEVEGWRLGLAICKDLGVPRHAADTAALGIDVYVAGTAKHIWETDHQAQGARRTAVEHGVWVAVASFAGSTGEGFDPAAGRSGIWDPTGLLVAGGDQDPGMSINATVESDGRP